MPYDLYWNGSLDAYFIYKEKDRIERAKRDAESWKQGKYIEGAVVSAIGMSFTKKGNLPKSTYYEEPFFILQQKQEEKQKKQILIQKQAKEIERHNKKIQEMLNKKGGDKNS